MDGRVGDRLVVKGHRVGEPNQVGEIVEVLANGRFRVRWVDGRETLMVKDLTVTVDLRIHEDRDGSRAQAVMRTASGVFRGAGEARRHPGDSGVPLIGEELAVARALADLASSLERAARDDIAAP